MAPAVEQEETAEEQQEAALVPTQPTRSESEVQKYWNEHPVEHRQWTDVYKRFREQYKIMYRKMKSGNPQLGHTMVRDGETTSMWRYREKRGKRTMLKEVWSHTWSTELEPVMYNAFGCEMKEQIVAAWNHIAPSIEQAAAEAGLEQKDEDAQVALPLSSTYSKDADRRRNVVMMYMQEELFQSMWKVWGELAFCMMEFKHPLNFTDSSGPVSSAT